MYTPSLNPLPSAFVLHSLSEPARSTMCSVERLFTHTETETDGGTEGAETAHICTGTGLTPLPTSAPGLRSPRPHLRRDCAHRMQFCSFVPTSLVVEISTRIVRIMCERDECLFKFVTPIARCFSASFRIAMIWLGLSMLHACARMRPHGRA